MKLSHCLIVCVHDEHDERNETEQTLVSDKLLFLSCFSSSLIKIIL